MKDFGGRYDAGVGLDLKLTAALKVNFLGAGSCRNGGNEDLGVKDLDLVVGCCLRLALRICFLAALLTTGSPLQRANHSVETLAAVSCDLASSFRIII